MEPFPKRCHALVPDESRTAEKLVADADEALYAAKQSGRNRVLRAFGGVMGTADSS